MDLTLRVDDAAGTEVFRGLATLPGRLRIDLPPGEYRLQGEAAGAWIGPLALVVESAAQKAVVRGWPTAPVRGSLRLDRDPPARLHVDFSPTPGDKPAPDQEPRGRVACRLERRDFTCDLPLGRMDLRFRGAGFASVFRWDQPITKAGLEVGALSLRPGGSIVGALVARGLRELPPNTKVQALLQRPGATLEDDPKARLHLQSFDGQLERGGLFHVDGLAPGPYWLVATAAGFAPAHGAAQVPGAVEAELRDPLELAPPVSLTVVVEPAVDTEGRAWTLEMSALDRYRQSKKVLDRVLLPPAGFAELDNLAPGSYELRLLRDGRQSLLSRLVEVEADMPPLILQVARVAVAGRVLLGDEGLVAELIFGGRQGARQLRTTSGEDGAYQIELPEAGRWRVDIDAQEPRINRRFRAIEIPKPQGDGPVELDFELPATVLKGRVVDEAGKPALVAMVFANAWEGGAPSAIFEKVDEEGRFRLAGLPPGKVQVSAEAPGDLQATPATVELDDDSESEIELVLRKKVRIHGTVAGLGQGLPGARVIVMPAAADPRLVEVTPLLTGADGSFATDLPPGVREVEITVAAPGWTLDSGRHAPGEDLRIELPRQGGRLEVAGLGEDLLDGWILRRDGSLVYPSVVGEWSAFPPSSRERGRLVLEGMAAGRYALCTLPPDQRCVEGPLVAGGRLELQLPAPPKVG